MKLAFATGPNGEFSYNNGLPWGKPIKEDMQHFVNFTSGTKLIMGYNTWTSLPSKVQEKYHDAIVIFSRKDQNYHDFNPSGRIYCNNMHEFISHMNVFREFERSPVDVEYCIIGGVGYIHASLIEDVPVTDVLYTSVTPNNGSFPCDSVLEQRALDALGSKFQLDTEIPYVTSDYNITVNYYTASGQNDV